MFPTDKDWKKKLKCFKQWRSVPDDFLGECYIQDINQIFWLKPNKVYHRINGPAVIHESGEIFDFSQNFLVLLIQSIMNILLKKCFENTLWFLNIN